VIVTVGAIMQTGGGSEWLNCARPIGFPRQASCRDDF